MSERGDSDKKGQKRIDFYKEKGTFYQFRIFEPDAEIDREFHAKGDQVIIYDPDDQTQMWKHHPRKGAKFSLPAGYAVRVIGIWLVWVEGVE